jgi:uncharacterized integral membrane protein
MARTERHELGDHQPAEPSTRSRLVQWAPQIIIAAVIVLFVAVNTNEVEVSYVVGDVRLPLWLALAVVALLGGLVGWFLGRRRLRRSASVG